MPRATDPALLVYDGRCGFCSAWAEWGERHLGQGEVDVRPSQSLDLPALGTSTERASREVLWIEPGGMVRGGSEVIAAWLGHGPWWARALGGLLALAPVRPLAGRVYRWVADHRYRLPAPRRR